jgi:C4-type Zn-finger protein
MKEHFIRKLMSTIKCSVCGEHYEANNIKVLGHRDNIWFLNASCPSCHSRALVAATIKEGQSSEAVTELTEAELTKFVEASPIGADDILDLHAFLQEFDGDFVELFSPK